MLQASLGARRTRRLAKPQLPTSCPLHRRLVASCLSCHHPSPGDTAEEVTDETLAPRSFRNTGEMCAECGGSGKRADARGVGGLSPRVVRTALFGGSMSSELIWRTLRKRRRKQQAVGLLSDSRALLDAGDTAQARPGRAVPACPVLAGTGCHICGLPS